MTYDSTVLISKTLQVDGQGDIFHCSVTSNSTKRLLVACFGNGTVGSRLLAWLVRCLCCYFWCWVGGSVDKYDAV